MSSAVKPSKCSSSTLSDVDCTTKPIRGRIVVYTISGCPYCRRAVSRLSSLGLPFIIINLDDVPNTHRQEMLDMTGGKTSVPQIFFNDKHLGGFEALEAAISNESIDDFLQEVLENRAPDTAPKVPRQEREFDVLDDYTDFQFQCEQDEYALLVREIRKSDLIADRYYHLRLYKQCFVGRELVDWLCTTKEIERSEALEIGVKLISRKFGHHVCNDHDFKDGYFFYRLLDDDESNSLNTKHHSECEPQSATEVAEVLRSSIVLLYNDYLSIDGRHVDYTSLASSKLFSQYEQLTAELLRLDIGKLTDNAEKIAFFINVYNALVIHANVERGPPKSAWDRQKFFNTSCYTIGGHVYSLQDIENGILRGNKKGVGALRKPFGKTDPRRISIVEQPDYRIHFALVCGAKSCPPIKTYTALGLDEELSLAANSFLQDGGVQVSVEKNEISLNRILAWYKSDFGSNTKEILQFVGNNMGSCDLKQEFDTVMAANPKVSYLAYDWTLNGS
ncbi:uncharacterized protein LOC135813068 [Sycon ciliatum]|uniref:uncharacterized protein LOC135813068 n=1 Tax=Sycon ciliatum TaxID=27933 RepID=UPI0031F606DB